MLPKVSVTYSNGNLLQNVTVLDGICAIIGTGVAGALLGVPKVVNNYDEAIKLGYTAGEAITKHIKEFYAEVGGNLRLFVMSVPDTMTMAQMLDNTNESGAKKLINFAGGEVRMLGVTRTPAAGYVGGADFIDTDVAAAVLASKAFATARLTELRPLRILIEGRVQNNASATIYAPNTASNGSAGVVLGGSTNDGAASVGLALGRAARFGAQIKIGAVKNGPVSIATAFIGNKEIKDVSNLEALHDKGFIILMQHPQKAGFYFGLDNMASTDDYRFLAYGRLVDKAAVIAAAVYIEQVESEVDVDENGNISEADVKHLEGKIEQQIDAVMAGQISGKEVIINPGQNIINTSKLTVKVRIRPKGYTSFIEVDLGITATGI